MADLRYLLDTNIFSDVARRPHGRAAQRMLAVGVAQVGVSIIVACEIRFGLTKRVSARLKRRIESLLEEMTVLPLDAPGMKPLQLEVVGPLQRNNRIRVAK
jgi:tRNA(fMet)-specific endonuclease VapC